tara:strand:- start:82128 stop:82661 length:534 start_codon:yes stop_codon:yes gene_type:complete
LGIKFDADRLSNIMSRKTQFEAEILEAVPHVRRFAYSLTRNASDADDLTQTVIERVLDKGVPDDAQMKKWMFRICRNLWIDGLRARKVRETAAPELAENAGTSVSSEQVASANMMVADTQRAIEALPDVYREVLTIIAIGGASYKDAASQLNVPIGTIMSRVGRARAMIADKVGYHD